MSAALSGTAAAPLPPRLAASVVVLRDGADGIEVLMLRRCARPNDENSEAVVFPGGVVSPNTDRAHGLCDGMDDEQASRRLSVPSHGLDFWMAAIRECFEECGLLFATRSGRSLDEPAADEHTLLALRRALHQQQADADTVCRQLGVRLNAGALTYLSHWITPAGTPKIFDTRFFIARAPQGQIAQPDGNEVVDAFWISPQAALTQGFKLMTVTTVTLRELARHASVDEALQAARGQQHVPTIRPRVARDARGARLAAIPSHPAYAEIGRLDPHGHRQALGALVPGRAVWLSPRVMRITADNGGPMTGPGTNSYFIGTPGGDEWALLDPGPTDPRHLSQLEALAPGRVTRVLVTHTHRDHSPAATPLAARFGARRGGQLAAFAEGQDGSFTPDDILADGQRLHLGSDATLRVLHTPGHASNHLCFLLEQEQLLFTGDHLMQGSTVVINPPDGDMSAYLASLHRLLQEPLAWLAPGHGFLIDQPHDAIRRVIAHRQQREARVVAALGRSAPIAEPALRDTVYADTPVALHAMALRSLLAHLYKLQAEGRAQRDDEGRWSTLPPC